MAEVSDGGMNWMKQKWLWLMLALKAALLTRALKNGRLDMNMIMGVVRALLAAGGGWVANKGWASNEEVTAIIGGLITVAVGLWSIIEKARAKAVNLKPAS